MSNPALTLPKVRTYRFITHNTPDAAKLSRDLVASLLTHNRCPVEVDTAKLLVSELVTNTHQHTCSPRIVLTTTIADDSVRVAVYDTNPLRTPAPVTQHEGPASTPEHGGASSCSRRAPPVGATNCTAEQNPSARRSGSSWPAHPPDAANRRQMKGNPVALSPSERAAFVRPLLDTYTRHCGGVISDLIADLLHLAASEGGDPETELARAAAHHAAEQPKADARATFHVELTVTEEVTYTFPTTVTLPRTKAATPTTLATHLAAHEDLWLDDLPVDGSGGSVEVNERKFDAATVISSTDS